jgi:hypothetical protein
LHFLADFNVYFEKLGDTAVEADRFAFVEVGFVVVLAKAFI